MGATAVRGAGVCSVTLSSAQQESIVVTDPGGTRSAPMPTAAGYLSIASPAGVEAMPVAKGLYKYFFMGNGQYRMVWHQGSDPSMVSFTCHLDGIRTHAYRYDAVQAGEGRTVELLMTVGAAPVLSIDSNGDGTADTEVTPDIAVSGTGASDSTPPVVTHARLPDGRHALALVDDEQDITGSGQLFYSLDNGSGYLRYTGPLRLDSRAVPRLLAIGRDLSGNRSDQYAFMTRNEDLPLCERLAGERETVRNVIGGVFTQAVSDGLIPASHGVTMVSTGPGACLWMRDDKGNDIVCAACKGRYAPIFDTQQILVLFPDSIAGAVRAQLLERLGASAALPQNDLTALSFAADDRATFESGLRAAAAGLAARLQLFEWLVQSEYVDLGAGGQNVTGTSLDAALSELLDAGISRTEGYEYSLRAERELLETGLLVRVLAMHDGMSASVPQLDPHLGRVLREQLQTAANMTLRAALGVLAADDCAVKSGLLAVSRNEFRTSACDGSGCASLADFSLARAGAAATQCAGLFSPDDLELLGELAALSARNVQALRAAVYDECVANGLLARSLRRIRAWQAALLPGYESLMQTLAGTSPEEHAQRQASAGAARNRIAALRARPALDLKFALVNTGTSAHTDARVMMYDNGSFNGQQLDFSPARETIQVFTGDHATGLPFYIEIDPAKLEANSVRNATFVLQTPGVDNAADPGETFGALQYYLFDPDKPICPNPTPVERPDSGGGG